MRHAQNIDVNIRIYHAHAHKFSQVHVQNCTDYLPILDTKKFKEGHNFCQNIPSCFPYTVINFALDGIVSVRHTSSCNDSMITSETLFVVLLVLRSTRV
jgi:hypothetical protein